MFKFNNFFDRCPPLLVPVAAIAMCAGHAAAQDDIEWEPDEGYHEEEWYDPSDWFDDDPGVDYETDWYEHGLYSDSYYDGYYDGYYDDDYGYDYWDADWDRDYTDGYTAGYYDGYYDQERSYDYDPYYYIYTVAVPRDQTQTQQQQGQQGQQQGQQGDRSSDETRQRGDRAAQSAQGDTAGQRRQAGQAASMKRIRGTVKAIAEADQAQRENHTVLRIAFEDREPVIADFGPNMSRDKLPLESDERATIVGRMERRDNQDVVIVSKIIEGGQTYTLRGPGRDAQQDRQQNRQKRREGSSSREGGG